MKFSGVLLFLSCVFFSASVDAAPIMVVTSFSILADLTREVAGDNAHIISLVGPNSDAHAYEPSPSDMRAIASADIVIVNGLGFEGWLDRLTQSSGFKGQLITASQGIIPRVVGQAPDPHAWQSVPNAKLYVATIRDGLIKADPAHGALYEENAGKYLRSLGELDIWVHAQIAHIPKEKRRAITSHDAFGYFGEAYRITFIAPLGLSTSGDISAGGMARLIDQIRDSHIKAVFLENMSDPRLIQQLIRDGGAVIGGTLYSDALSAPDGPAPTYIMMMRYNVTTMVETMAKN